VQGESTLWGGHVGHFYNKYYSMHFLNVMHLILGFTFGVWVLYFDNFHKDNVNLIFLKNNLRLNSRSHGYMLNTIQQNSFLV
jgi:hypothetical protein